MRKALLGDVAVEHTQTCKYRFEQIAINSTEKKKPVEEDRFTYLGLEHLDSGNLKVTRFGSDVAPIGEKLVMREGDVLFGKRRAYQKKVAIAPFDGIFSAHGMVLRPNEDVIDPDFFPLFISSDYFLDAAIKISVGSLSPTINWRDLRILEFELPDMDKQRELAALLWAMDDTKKSYQKLIAATDELVKSQFIEMFGDPVTNPMGWEVKPLQSLGTLKNGINFSNRDSGVSIKCLGVGDFQSNTIIDDAKGLSEINLNKMPPDDYLLRNGDIVFVRSNGNKELVGRSLVTYPGEVPTTFSGFCIRLRLTEGTGTVNYLSHMLRHSSVKEQMFRDVRGANITNLNQKILSEIAIPLPPLPLQQRFADFVRQADKSKFELEQALAGLTATYKCIIAENLG